MGMGTLQVVQRARQARTYGGHMAGSQWQAEFRMRLAGAGGPSRRQAVARQRSTGPGARLYRSYRLGEGGGSAASGMVGACGAVRGPGGAYER